MNNYSPAFNYAFNTVIGIEGKLTDDKNDSGGLTKYGISQKAYPHVDIANLTLEQAQYIYHTDYWQHYSCDLLPNEFAIVFFDGLVNEGQPTAAKMLQQFLAVKVDFEVGIITAKTANNYANHWGQDSLICNFLAIRLKQYISFNRPEYLNGWEQRLFQIALAAARFKE